MEKFRARCESGSDAKQMNRFPPPIRNCRLFLTIAYSHTALMGILHTIWNNTNKRKKNVNLFFFRRVTPFFLFFYYFFKSPKAVRTDNNEENVNHFSEFVPTDAALGKGRTDDGLDGEESRDPNERRQVQAVCPSASAQLLCHHHVHGPAASEAVWSVQVRR